MVNADKSKFVCHKIIIFPVYVKDITVAASRGIIGNAAVVNASAKEPKPIVVEGYAKKSHWSGTTLELSVGFKSTYGKIKKYKGTCTV